MTIQFILSRYCIVLSLLTFRAKAENQIPSLAVFEGVKRIMTRERAGSCYTAVAVTSTRSNDIQRHLFESSIPADDLERSGHGCADHSVLFIDGLLRFKRLSPNLTQFRMYVVVNDAQDQDPNDIIADIGLNNLVWVQKVSGGKAKNLFAIYEKKTGRMEKTWAWNGEFFFNAAKNEIRSSFSRSVKGEAIRVGSTTFPPFTRVQTDANDRLIKGGGIEVILLLLITPFNTLGLSILSPTNTVKSRFKV